MKRGLASRKSKGDGIPDEPHDRRPGVSAHTLSRLGRFIDELQQLHLEIPRDEGTAGNTGDFVPLLECRLKEGVDLLRWSENQHAGLVEDLTPAETPSSLTDIGHLISDEIAGQEIADVLYLARSELRGALQDLRQAAEAPDPFRVLSSCDSGLRTLKRCLIAVESTLSEYEEVEPPIRQWADLEVSLRTRRLYGELRRHLRGARPTEGELASRLRFIAGQIDSIRELDIYPLLRFDDRSAMRGLRDRLRVLLDHYVVLDPTEGIRLWQDVIGFAELLKEVSYRQELRQHDRNLVRRTYHKLFGRASRPAGVTEDTLFQMRALLGLDDELDDLILAGPTSDLDGWREVLARLLHSLTQSVVPMGTDWPEA